MSGISNNHKRYAKQEVLRIGTQDKMGWCDVEFTDITVRSKRPLINRLKLKKGVVKGITVYTEGNTNYLAFDQQGHKRSGFDAAETGRWKCSFKLNPLDAEGFVYRIRCISSDKEYGGMEYIGKKSYWAYTKSKRAGQSNWKRYVGSSDHLGEAIKKLGEDAFSFEIVAEAWDKSTLNLAEVTLQCTMEVLTATFPTGRKKFFNKSIGSEKWGITDNNLPRAKQTMDRIKRCK